MKKFHPTYWCAEGYTNNWRRLHHYPMRKKYRCNRKWHYTHPCALLQSKGLCSLPFWLNMISDNNAKQKGTYVWKRTD